VAHVPEERQSDRQQDALLNADRENCRRGADGTVKFARTFAANVTQFRHVDHSDRDREHNTSQHAARQVLQRAGQEQQYQQRDGRKYQLGDLAARADAICHGGLRRAAVYHECSAHGGSCIRSWQPEDIRVLVDALVMAHGKSVRRGGALRDYHHEARSGHRRHRQQCQDFAPGHVR
jgi:hypothetical protein